MKRFLSLILVFAMMLSVVSMTSVVNAIGGVTHGYILADANDDKAVDLKDVLVTRRYAMAHSGITEKDIFLKAADVDKDNSVNMADVVGIRRIVLGIIVSKGNNTDNRYKVDEASIGGLNISRFTIVYPEDTDETKIWEAMDNAVSMLQTFVNRACGVTLNRTTDEASVTGYKIKFSFDTENVYDLGKEGYRLAVDRETGDLNVICGSMRGPVYAAVHLIENYLGFRFLPDYNTYVEYLYEADCVNLPADYDVT